MMMCLSQMCFATRQEDQSKYSSDVSSSSTLAWIEKAKDSPAVMGSTTTHLLKGALVKECRSKTCDILSDHLA